MKNLYYGFLHVLVSLTAILFVAGVTGLNLSAVFLAVGIGTLIFHATTKNKLAVLMGVSGSYIAGITYIAQTYGPQYIGFGVIGAGIIYILFGLLYKKTNIKFPRYILSMAVILIALTLLPIGATLAKGNAIVVLATILFTFIFRKSIYAMPIGLLAGTSVYYMTGGQMKLAQASHLMLQMPKFSWGALGAISVVAIAAAFEALGDMTNCAHAQGIEIDVDDYSRGLMGNGFSSIVAGFIGAPPLTTYSENIGFIYLSGWKDASAQIFSGLIYIVMAFIPQLSILFSFIPTQVFGALLLYLFALIMVGNLEHLEGFRGEVIFIMLVAFYATSAILPSVSPIAVAMILGLIADRLSV